MRIYNARKSQISIPLTATEKIVVPSFGTSESFLPNPKILSLIVTSFDYSDIALIISGPNEMTMCSETPCAAGFVVNSLEEALERFAVKTNASMKCAAKVIDPINEERLKAEKAAEKVEEPEPEVLESADIQEFVVEEAEQQAPEEPKPVVEEPVDQAAPTTTTKKKRNKKK